MQHSKKRTMSNWVLVFIGGGLGSMLRFAISRWLGPVEGFPWATFIANFLAALLLGGVLFALLEAYPHKHHLRLLLAVGFCGGFSTFSAFSYETFNLLTAQQYPLAAAYVAASVVACLAAVAVGWWSTQWWLQG